MVGPRFLLIMMLINLITSDPLLGAWGGIPTRKVGPVESDPHRMDNKISEDLKTAEQFLIEETAEPLNAPQTTTTKPDITTEETVTSTRFTELEDLEAEWAIFDQEWGWASDNNEQEASEDHRLDALMTAYSIRSLVWPVSLVTGSLLLSVVIILALCWARKQIYCCGKPCLDSSLDAASNYDRSALRKEKLKMMGSNPLMCRGLDQTEMQGIATCLQEQNVVAGKMMNREIQHVDFMEEYARRYPGATFRPIDPAPLVSRTRATVPRTQKEPAVIFVHVPTKPKFAGKPDEAHVYDEVQGVVVKEI